jgi:hypothetical protein
MKKTLIYSLATLFLAGLMVFQSCTGTETADPIVVVSSSSDGWDGASNTFTGDIGDTLALDITVTADGIFNTVRITDADGATAFEDTRSEDGQTSYEGTFTYVLMEENAGDTMEWTVAGIDDAMASTEETVTVIVNEKQTPVVKYTAKLLYAPLADNTAKNFFSTDDGATYSNNDVTQTADPVSPMIDFGYYYGATDNASMSSPAEFPELFADVSSWGTKNETLMKKSTMDVSHFEMINTNADLMTHYGMTDMADATGGVTALAVDDLVAFELDAAKGSKKGFFKVIAINGTFNSGDYIEIEVVVEGEEE